VTTPLQPFKTVEAVTEMPRPRKIINPAEPVPVHVLKQSSYVVVPIPKPLAKYLDLIEGQSVLEVHVEDGKLVYSPKPIPSYVESMIMESSP
jgi:hypothetical protein